MTPLRPSRRGLVAETFGTWGRLWVAFFTIVPFLFLMPWLASVLESWIPVHVESGTREQAWWAVFGLGGLMLVLTARHESEVNRDRLEREAERDQRQRTELRLAEAVRNLESPGFGRFAGILSLGILAESVIDHPPTDAEPTTKMEPRSPREFEVDSATARSIGQLLASVVSIRPPHASASTKPTAVYVRQATQDLLVAPPEQAARGEAFAALLRCWSALAVRSVSDAFLTDGVVRDVPPTSPSEADERLTIENSDFRSVTFYLVDFASVSLYNCAFDSCVFRRCTGLPQVDTYSRFIRVRLR